MKYVILSVLVLLISGHAMANDEYSTNAYYEVCKNEGAVVFVLHKDIDGTVKSADNTTKKWSVELPYDVLAGGTPYQAEKYAGKTNVIKGISACSTINVKSAENGSGYNGGAITPGDVNTFAIMTDVSYGPKCWCRFTGPVTSWWTYVREYSDDNECAQNCTTYCANGFAGNVKLSNGRMSRNAMIDGVW